MGARGAPGGREDGYRTMGAREWLVDGRPALTVGVRRRLGCPDCGRRCSAVPVRARASVPTVDRGGELRISARPRWSGVPMSVRAPAVCVRGRCAVCPGGSGILRGVVRRTRVCRVPGSRDRESQGGWCHAEVCARGRDGACRRDGRFERVQVARQGRGGCLSQGGHLRRSWGERLCQGGWLCQDEKPRQDE